MTDSLASAFATYLELVRAAQPSRKTDSSSIQLHVLQSEKQRITSIVENLEQTPEFLSLATTAATELSGKSSDTNFKHFSEHDLKTFLRLAGTYETYLSDEAYARAVEEHMILASALRSEVCAPKQHLLHLVPIEFISFSEDLMEFDGFKIQQFTKNELDALLMQRVCRLFFPWAIIDTEELASYWFLVCEDEKELSLAGTWIGARRSPSAILRLLAR